MHFIEDKKVIEGLNTLKRHIFYELLNLIGRVFIVVRYHESVKIGRRGFLPEEKQKGIVLVFNHKMNFQWHDWGIEARLVFGGSVEHCLIPVEHIIAIYSPEINTQFLSLPDLKPEDLHEEAQSSREVNKVENDINKHDKVIKLDFKKRKSSE